MLSRLSSGSLFAAVAALFSVSASAATPDNGELSPSSPALSYEAGPFVVSNPSGETPPGIGCSTSLCDDYALTVTLPDDYATTHPDDQIQIIVSWDNATEDYDVYLLDENGDPVKNAASSSDPEVMRIPAGSGARQYTIHVIPYLVAGSTFSANITLVSPSNAPPPAQQQPDGAPPRYLSYESPEELGNNAGEPTIGWNRNTNRAMFLSYTQVLRVTFPEFGDQTDVAGDPLPESCDPLWEDKSGNITSVISFDPILQTIESTGRTMVSQMVSAIVTFPAYAGANSLFEYTDDDGETWIPGQIAPPQGSYDHQSLGSGPYPEGLQLPTYYDEAVYYCEQAGQVAFCSRSDDGGQTFGPGIEFRDVLECGSGAIHGHPQVAPDGTVYVPNRVCATGQSLSVSTDAGLTWTNANIPNTEPAQKDPALGIASDGTAYVCYEAPDGTAHAVVTHDRGQTWENDYDLNRSLGIARSRFVSVVAGDPDRASCAFIGTPDSGNTESLDFQGVFYGYVATTYDGGKSWHTVNVTPNDPIQGYGGVCVSGSGCSPGTNRNLLDFIDIQKDQFGHTLVAYADGCIGDCVTDPAKNTFADKALIVRQTGGRPLFAQYDPSVPAIAARSCLAGGRNKLRSTLQWRTGDNGGSDVSEYKIFRGTDLAGPFQQIASVSGKTAYADYDVDPAVQNYYYKVSAVNGAGESLPSNLIELPALDESAESSCLLPGLTLYADGPGDNTDGTDATDLRYTAIAEPEDLAGNFVVTMKVTGFDAGAPPPNFNWVTYLTLPDGSEKYVAMNTGEVLPRFVYGSTSVQDTPAAAVRVFTEDGELDAASGWQDDGTISLVVPYAAFGLNVGDELSNITTSVRTFNDANGAGLSVDTSTVTSYSLLGVEVCATNTAPVAALQVLGVGGTAPVTVTLDASGSYDADGDDIVSYTFIPGDDSDPIESTESKITHTYQTNGEYVARVTVTDARGKASDNSASQILTLDGTAGGGGGGGSTSDGGRFGGGSLGGGLLLMLAGAAALRRRYPR